MSIVTHDHPGATPEPAPVDVNRRGRFAAQRLLSGDVHPLVKSSLDRVRSCGRGLASGSDGVQLRVTQTEHGNRAAYAGLSTCGSVWACPHCSAKILSARQDEIAAAVRVWKERGGRVAFFTYTVRHHRDDPAAAVWDAVQAGHHAITSGEIHQAEKERYGHVVSRELVTVCDVASCGSVVDCKVKSCGTDTPAGRKHALTDCGHGGPTKRAARHARVCMLGKYRVKAVLPWVRVVEVTLGASGWHVHQHMVVFLPGDFTDSDRDAVYDTWWGRWAEGAAAVGFDGAQKVNRAIWIDNVDAVAKYTTKNTYTPADHITPEAAGFEVARGDLKSGRFGNRSAMELLRDLVGSRSPADLALWHEFEQASRGRRQMTWAHGARELLIPDVEDLTDEEIAAQDLGSVDDSLVVIGLASYRRSILYPQGRRALLLETAERDPAAIFDLLDSWSVEWSYADGGTSSTVSQPHLLRQGLLRRFG